MAFTVLQRGAASPASATVTFGSPTTAGSCLIVVAVSNVGGGGCTAKTAAGAVTPLMGAQYGAGHNGDWAGIWFLPPAANHGGLTSATVAGGYEAGFLEVTGTAGYPQILAGYTAAGNATASTTFTCANPGASAANFTVFAYGYDVSNGGTALSDGTGNAQVLSNYGQYSYTLTAAGSSGTMTSRTYDCAAVSFAPASAGGLTPAVLPPVGVFRGPCGAKLQDSDTPHGGAGWRPRLRAVAGPPGQLRARLCG